MGLRRNCRFIGRVILQYPFSPACRLSNPVIILTSTLLRTVMNHLRSSPGNAWTLVYRKQCLTAPCPPEPNVRELADLVSARMNRESVYETTIRGSWSRSASRTGPTAPASSTVYEPSIVRDSPRAARPIRAGRPRDCLRGALSYMVVSVDLPVERGPPPPVDRCLTGESFLAVKIKGIDPAESRRAVLQNSAMPRPPANPSIALIPACGLVCGPGLDLGHLDAMTRLVRPDLNSARRCPGAGFPR